MDSARELEGLVARARDQGSLGEGDAATVCAAAITAAEGISDRRAAAEALCTLATDYLTFGRKQEAGLLARAALDRFVPPEPELWQAEAWSLLGAVRRQQGRHAEAADHAREVIVIARHIGSRSMEGTAHNNLGIVLSTLGEHDQALTHYLEALAIIAPLDGAEATRLRIFLYANVADLHMEGRDHRRAAEHLACALELVAKMGWPLVQVRLARKRAVCLRRNGRSAEGVAQLDEIVPLFGAPELFGGIVDQCRAEIAVLAGDRAAAAHHYRRALALERPIASARQVARLSLDLASALDPATDEVLALLEEARHVAEAERGCSGMHCDTLELLSAHHEARGELAAALRYTREAAILERSLFELARRRQQGELEARFDLARRAWEANWHRAQNEELTRRVDERTRELQDANQRLQSARDRAEAADRMKTGFLAAASHELRTPLNAIIGYGELIREELGDSDPRELAESADRLLDSADRLLQLVDRILQMTNLEAGATHVRSGPVPIPPLLGEVARLIERSSCRQENRLTWDCAPDLGVPHTDMTLLRSVLFNLVENAHKFTTRGEVRIEARRDGPLLVVAVADTGIGMSAEELARLFQPFTQLESGFTRRFGGLGLGLALGRRYCQLLGGELTVRSEVGHGSVFEIRIPFLLR